MGLIESTMSGVLINVIPGTLVDDFFFFGFLGGFVGYAYYTFVTKNHHVMDKNIFVMLYGLIISGCLGGLLAIVFDRSIELSILVGLLHQFLYLSIIRLTETGEGWGTIKQILIKLLTAGAVK